MVREIKQLREAPPAVQIETITHEVDWDKLTQLWTQQLANPATRAAFTVVRETNGGSAVEPRSPALASSAGTRPEPPPPNARPLPRPSQAPPPLIVDGLSQPQQRILDGLATLESMRVRVGAWSIVAMLGKQSPKSSGFEKNVSILRSRQLIEGGRAGLNLTEAGRKVAQWPAFKMTPTAIQGAVLAMISGPQQRMLNVLIERYPREVEWTYLADKSNQSPTSSGFEKNVSVLRSLGLVVGGRAGLSAAPVLFLEG
jgi:hypothetical protein